MNNIKISYFLLLCLCTLSFSTPSDAAVKSRTVEVDVIENGATIGKKVTVSCRENNDKRDIVKLNGAREWCDARFPEMCARAKGALSETVCSKRYRNKLAETKQAPAKAAVAKQAPVKAKPAPVKPTPVKAAPVVAKNNDIAKLEAELVEIEQKRIDIADKVLKLKRRELALRKTLN